MGFPIPEPFKWDDSFKVFYENLDKEHQGLFDGIFALCNDRDNAAVLGDLRTKVKAHFDTEEAMMTKANLPDLDEHKGKHAKFVSDLAAVTVVNDDTLKFAKEWLVNHIKETDFKYKGKL